MILRLANRADHEAWTHFDLVYRAFVHQLAIKRGLQNADAEEVVQVVFANVSKALEKRSHDWTKAKFRTWLYRVTNNAIFNHIRDQRPDLGTGETASLRRLNEVFDPSQSDEFDTAYQQAVFEWAARLVRTEFQADTWRAFWMTTVEGFSCEAAAQKIGVNVGSVYASRSRIIRRLREKVEEFDDSCQIE